MATYCFFNSYQIIDKLIVTSSDGKKVAFIAKTGGLQCAPSPLFEILWRNLLTSPEMDALCNNLFDKYSFWFDKAIFALYRLMYPDTLAAESKIKYEQYMGKYSYKALAACFLAGDPEGIQFLKNSNYLKVNSIKKGVEFLFKSNKIKSEYLEFVSNNGFSEIYDAMFSHNKIIDG